MGTWANQFRLVKKAGEEIKMLGYNIRTRTPHVNWQDTIPNQGFEETVEMPLETQHMGLGELPDGGVSGKWRSLMRRFNFSATHNSR